MAEKQESDYRKRSDAARERNKALRAIPWNQRIAMQRERNAEKLQKQINAWLNGGASFQAYGIDTMLRIKGDNVETSRDASFPVSHAKRGLALVEAVIASKEEWKRNGKTCRLGHYQIDRIEPNGTVHAGCHVVTYKAIERIREALIAHPGTAVA
jgi:hypothetical protein